MQALAHVQSLKPAAAAAAYRALEELFRDDPALAETDSPGERE